MARTLGIPRASLAPLALLALAAGGALTLGAPLACSSSTPAAPVARTCTLAAPSRANWRLVASGTQLVDAQGRVIALRGVDAGGRSKLAPFAPFDFDPQTKGSYEAALGSYMDRAQSWGVDVMRVPFVWAAVEPVRGQDDADFLARYDALLDAAWARGIWTVVDFHQDVYAESFCGDGFPAWTIPDPKPAPHHDCANWALQYFQDAGVKAAFDAFWAAGSSVQADFVALWDRMVARYKDRPGVLGFEPINEPSAGSADPDTWEATTLSDFYARIVARMRGAAPTSLVFVDPSGTDGAFLSTKLVRPAGDGVVFAPHFYPLLGLDATRVQASFANWVSMGQAWSAPVFVGEFGVVGDTPVIHDFMAAHFAAFDALGIGGTEWEYSASTTSWNDEGMSIVDGDGTEHQVVRAVTRPYARAIAGTSVIATWDEPSRAFTLTYTAAGQAISEVALPGRAFPGGYDVQLSGGCYDATSSPGVMLVQPDPGAASLTLHVSGR